MFLKSEPFKYNGHSVTLYELSALHRIEHLRYISEEYTSLPDEADPTRNSCAIAMTIRTAARVVAMSLSQEKPGEKDIETLHKEVLSGWTIQMISAGEIFVKKLSDMLPPEPDKTTDPDNSVENDNTEQSPEKLTPAN